MTSFAHIASHVAQADWRPTEDVGNHDHGRPGTLSWSRIVGYARWRMDWVKVSGTVKSGMLLPETWSILLVMATQPAPDEC